MTIVEKPRYRNEEVEQSMLMKWASYEEAVYPDLKLLFHIPNGGLRSPSEAARLKAAGVKAGVPDLFLPVPKGHYHGLWIEMKYGKNKPSGPQKLWLDNLIRRGYRAEVCYGFEEARKVIEEYLDLKGEEESK